MANGYSIHVGVNHSGFGTGGDAPGAGPAATAMAGIAKQLGYAQRVVLTDTTDNTDPSRQPSLEAFRQTFTRLAAGLVDGDILMLTFCAHGKQLLGDSVCPDEHNQAVRLTDGLLVDVDLYGMLKSITQKARVIIVADVCNGKGLFEKLSEEFGALFGLQMTRKSNLLRQIFDAFAPRPAKMFPCQQLITANILLLAPTESTPAASGPNSVPPFTQAVLDNFAKSRDYDELVTKMTAGLGGGSVAEPFLSVKLQNDPAFEKERPFSI